MLMKVLGYIIGISLAVFLLAVVKILVELMERFILLVVVAIWDILRGGY